jgi:hypothetical protein
VTKQLFVAAWTLTVMLQVPSAIAADWTQKLPAKSPSGRHGHAMAYDSAHGQVVLFGGLGADNTVLSDTWTWDGSNWTQKIARQQSARAELPRHGLRFASSASRVIRRVHE